ncbi:MAG: peptidase, partial [bacterium]|nr:peptidase [bacterium]
HPSGVAAPSATDAASARPDSSLWLIVAGADARLWMAGSGADGTAGFVEVMLDIR